MSSGEIWGEIQACEGQISRTQQEIVKLTDEVEDQEYSIRIFGRRVDYFFEETNDKAGKIDSVVAYTPKAVVSVRFGEGVDIAFANKKSTTDEAIGDMEEGMRRELWNKVDELEMAETRLRQLKNTRDSLYGDYNAALAREEAERQAAARAAEEAAAAAMR